MPYPAPIRKKRNRVETDGGAMSGVVKVCAGRELRRRTGFAGRVPDHLALLKPRVMSLVVFTGAVGMAVAPGHIDATRAAATLICMAAGAGGCGALNMWYDADIDGIMQRTAGRPIPANRIAAREALFTGLLLSVLSVLTLGLLVNPAAGAFLALTVAIYVPLYTMFLKRRTARNIVLGGAAGALPPVIGWAAVTGSAGLGALSLFLIIFLWTPPHFWALAICRSSDYERANIPMLPVVAGPGETARQISIYSALLVAASFLPPLLGIAGIVYTALAAVLGAVFLVRAFAIQREHETERRNRAAYRLFGFSIFYMSALFLALLAGAF
jgi:protoheme IX farnesyltransferase